MYTAKNDYRAYCEDLDISRNSITHSGIKGQKWGLRRFQNQDGTLTEAGKQRYGVGLKKKDISSAKTSSELDKKALANSERRYHRAVKVGVAGLATGIVAHRMLAKGGLNLLFDQGSTNANAARVAIGTFGSVASKGAGVAAAILLAKGGLTSHNISKRRLELNAKKAAH